MEIVARMSEARSRSRGRVGLVPTMGYFHEGHLALMQRARADCDTVVVSLFVNPLQFNDPADLARYPRDLARDAALAAGAGVDLLFAPEPEEMFAEPPRARVVVSGLTDRMEGPHRPGHFDGVATVVAKLFAGLQPRLAFFGRKDAQQLAVVRRMAADLGFPLTVVGCPIVREPDGLALSSRNVFLTSEDRPAALGLSRGLFAAARAVVRGERDGAVLERLVREASGGMTFEYVELASQDTVERLAVLDRPAFLAVAARVGAVRLIDNVAFDPEREGGFAADLGVSLDRPGLLSGEG
jgi:pantoate--beta-alanine ligase